ncbi:hypothetical protein [Streptomyces pinistramenti]
MAALGLRPWRLLPGTRAELRDVCVGAVLGAIRPFLDEDPAPDRPR